MRIKKSLTLILINILFGGLLFANTSSKDKEEEVKEHPVTILEQNAEFYYDGTDLKKYTFYQKFVINNQKGADSWNYVSSGWSPWYQKKPVITAKVTNPDGKVYELDQATIVEVGTKDRNDDIYSDQKKLKAPLASIKIGSIVEENIIRESSKPFFSAGYDRSFYIQDNIPINKLNIKINVPADVKIKFKPFLFDFEPEVETIDNRKIYTLSFTEQEALESRPILSGKDYRHWPMLFWTTAKDWKSVVQDYKKMVEPQAKFDSSVDKFLETVDLTGSKHEQITNILMHMHKEVRYTGLELGESSIVPHTPDEVISRKYGDCKDKALLLQSLLKRIDVKSHVALLKAGYGPDVPEDIPGIRQFNHAILYLPEPFNIWIDATSEFSRLGELPVASSDRRALIIADKTTALATTTAQKPEDNVRTLTHDIYMSQLGDAKVVERMESKGYFGMNKRSYFHSLSEKELDEQLSDYAESAFNSDSYEDLSYLPGMDLTKDFFVEFSMPETNFGYTESSHAETYLNLSKVFSILPDQLLNLQYYEEKGGEEEDSDWYEREIPAALSFPFITRHNYIVHFPDGFSVNELPENEEYKFGTSIYKRSFREENNTVVIETELNSGLAVFTPEEIKDLRAYIYKLNNESRQKIVATSFKNMFVQDDEFENCVNYYKDKIKEEPGEISHHVRLADTYVEAGFAKAGQKHLEKALEIDKENVEARMAYAYSNLYDEWGRSDKSGKKAEKAISEYLKVTEIDPEIGNAWQNMAVISEYCPKGYRYNEGANYEDALKYYDKYVEHIKSNNLDYNVLLDLFKLGRFDDIIGKIDMIKSLNTFEAWSMYYTVIALKEGHENTYKYISSLTSSPEHQKRLIETTVGNLEQLREYKLSASMLSYIDKSAEKYIEIENKIKFLNKLGHYEDAEFDDSKPETVVKKFWFSAFSKEDITKEDITKLFSDKFVKEEGVDDLIEELQTIKDDFIHDALIENKSLETMRDYLLTTLEFRTEKAGDIYNINASMTLPTGQISQSFYVREESGIFKIIHNDIPWLAYESVNLLLDKGEKVDAIRILNWILDGCNKNEYRSIFSSVWKSNKRSDSWIKMGIAALTYQLEESTELILSLENDFIKKGLLEEYTWILAMHYEKKGLYNQAFDVVDKFAQEEGLSSDMANEFFDIYHKAGKASVYEKLLKESLKFEPNSLGLQNLVVMNLSIQDKYDEAFEALKSFVESNNENALLYNQLAWYGLFTDQTAESLLPYAIKANQLSKFENRAQLHTLSVLLAETGKVKQSREILLYLIGNKQNRTLDDEYYIMGLNAETMGLKEEAIYYYSQLKKPEEDIAAATYILGQKKLKSLQ